jgi:ATP-binding cassette subfamily F protein uup
MLSPCDILFLDEPTNDLDILSLEVLEQSIKQFPGAVVIVSHDRFLMDRVCHKILYLDADKGAQFFKDFDQILNFRQKNIAEKPQKIKKNVKKKKSSSIAFTYKEKYELENIEEKILTQEDLIKDLTNKIQKPEIINNLEKMKHFCSNLEHSQEKVNMLYERWEYLENKQQSTTE